MISEYLDKSIRNCKNRGQLKLALEDISNFPIKTISGFAEAFYFCASAAYNAQYDLVEKGLLYFVKIGYITEAEREFLHHIINIAVRIY